MGKLLYWDSGDGGRKLGVGELGESWALSSFWYDSALGFGFSFLLQSGQSNPFALANAVCLVFGLLQLQ